MTVETDINTVLKGLVSNRCFPDFAPSGTAHPYITYQQIGGDAVTFVERAMPSKKNGHFQVNVWADSRASAASIMLQVESAITLATAFQGEALSASSSDFDSDMLLYGARQDFSIWSDR